jgi:hypothetical protein
MDVLGIPQRMNTANRQAVLSVLSVSCSPPAALAVDARKDRLLLTKQLQHNVMSSWVEGLSSVYKRVDPYQDGAVFISYRSYLGEIPRFLFPYSACRFKPRNEDAVDLLAHLFQLTQASWVADFDTLSDEADIGDFLVEMMTLYFRAAIYTKDYTRAEHNKDVATDIWSNLSSFPPTQFTAFDCEDGAHWILQLLFVFRSVDLSASTCKVAPHLRALQEFMKPYTPCFTLVELLLNQRHETVRHALVTMLDTRYLLKEPRVSNYHTALVFESTALTRGAWKSSRIRTETTANTQAVIEYDECLKLYSRVDEKYRRVAKVVAPVAVVVQRGMYQRVWSLICPDIQGRLKQFVVCKESSAGPRFVEDVAKFLTYQEQSSCLHVAVDIDNRPMLDYLTEEFPHSILPRVPPAPQYKRVADKKVRYWIRKHEFEADKSMWENAFKSYDHVVETTSYPIVGELEAVAVDI